MQTIWCKACKKLEQTEKKINPLNCSKRVVDGVEYLACFLHPAADPVEYAYPAYAFNDNLEAHAKLIKKS